ncbi:YjjG family noncanonical pyrimidine nucleotidase [Croceiramulus getboli]|nr:YjjG family noncanonical pyrimidine nucleotidase [Flavobacteriaceae bacterium YJPT1-3]
MTNSRASKHLFFDLDHTLWDFDKNSQLAFEIIFEKHRIDVKIEEFSAVYEPINFSLWKQYRENRISKEKLRYSRLKRSFEALDLEIDDPLIDRLSDDYIKFLPTNNHLFEGTLELLDYLAPRYRLHIITNGFQEVQQQKLKASNLQPYFEVVVSSESVAVKKPDPKIFSYALNKAAARPEQSLMIGDTYEADILGALNSGMDAVFFNHRGHAVDREVKQITHLSELKKLL